LGGRKGAVFSRGVAVWDIPCEEHTLFTLAPTMVCLRKALVAPDACAACDLLLLHSCAKNSQDPKKPPAPLRVSSTVLTLPSRPEMPVVTPPVPSGVAGSGVRGCRLPNVQNWSSSSAAASQVADA